MAGSSRPYFTFLLSFFMVYIVAFKSLFVPWGVVQLELALLVTPLAVIIGALIEPLVVAKL